MTESIPDSAPGPEATPAAASAVAETPVTETPVTEPAPPARVLPTEADVARFIQGEDVPQIENLFNLRPIKMYDALYMQIKKAELLPQHWQIIKRDNVPSDDTFETLAAVGRLRTTYKDQEKSRRRLEQLKAAWLALAGKNPSRWTADDLFVAMRRMLDSGNKPDYHELLSAVRDVWRGHQLPLGKEQLELLWACLDFARQKTKK